MSTLKSEKWNNAGELLRKSHLSLLDADTTNDEVWKTAFQALVDAIKDERVLNPAFSAELADIDEATEDKYSIIDWLEEYFDKLEADADWDAVVVSSDEVVSLFKWDNAMPSQYKFRKGNALQNSGRLDEAEEFGREWLEEYPYDLNAAASNAFLKVALQKYDEAKDLTEKYLRDDLVCDDATETFFMAAYRLYEMTDDINAKQRVEQKIAEYNAMVQGI